MTRSERVKSRQAMLLATVAMAIFSSPAFGQAVPSTSVGQAEAPPTTPPGRAVGSVGPSDGIIKNDVSLDDQQGLPGPQDSADIVITGSRLGRSAFESTSPVSVLGEGDIKLSGSNTVEDVLNDLPQVQPGDNSSTVRGDGIVTVDLRALGPARTLVLVNGKRLVPTTSRGVVDLNNVPTALIARADVVTGGASAVYGSDALAGVVNFILKRDFQGLEVGGQYGLTTRGDGDKLDLSATLGTNFAEDRGNVVLFASYAKRDAVLQRDRKLFQFDVNGGSPTAPDGRFDNIGLNPFPTAQTFLGSGGAVRDYRFLPNGSVEPFTAALANVNPDGDNYNIPALNHLQTSLKRISIAALGHYEITPSIEAYIEALYTDTRVTQQQAPTPAVDLFVSPTNPLLTGQVRALLAARPNPAANAVFRKRFLEVGPRIARNNSDVYQLNLGLRGDISATWKWEAYYSYGRSEFRQDLKGDVSRSRVQASLLGCPVGSAVIGCRLIDFFGANKLTQADVDYVAIGNQVDTLTFERQVANAFISGSPFSLPGGDVGIVIGAEYRKDASDYDPSESGRRGDQLGFVQKLPITGSFDVKELFGELALPILKDRFFFKDLSLEFGARYADYSSVGGVFTFKAGGSYSPVSDIRIRGVYQQATRAPSVFELFQAGEVAFITFTDPCVRVRSNGSAVPAPSAAVSQICVLQGAPDPRNDPSFTQISRTIEVTEVGNPTLREETAKTLNIGAVLEPRFIPGLTLSVDYFDITIDNYINRAFGGIAGVSNACFASGVTTASTYAVDPACSLLFRDASAQLRGRVPLQNTTPLKTSGWDFQLRYRLGLDSVGLGNLGSLLLNAAATYTESFEYNGRDYVGLLTQDFQVLNLPKLRTTTKLTWDAGDVTTSVTWRRLGAVREQTSNTRVPVINYIDAAVSFDPSQTVNLFIGVNNLFDRDPPVIRNQFFNSDPSTYDVLGRYAFAGARIRF